MLNLTLSKSLYTKGIQCPKLLWLKKHKPSVLTPPDASTKAIFETGKEVEALAYRLFTNGKEVAYKDISKMVAATQAYLDAKVPSIYQAAFVDQEMVVIVDILKVDDDGVHIYEVKSSTERKDIYLHDLSIQYYLLTNLGLRVQSANLIYINNEYVRGEQIEPKELFCVDNVSDEVQALQTDIPTILQEFRAYLSDSHNEPDIEIGKQCKNPYVCDAKDYCWKVQRAIPDYSIFDIFNLGSKKQMALYSQGIVAIEDIPDDFAMTPNQAREVQNHKAQTTFIDHERIKAFCDELTYPIYHLDFETYQQAIPKYRGLKPFEQIPFQYSLHIEQADGSLEHREFLAEDGEDSRERIAQKLVEDIPTDVTVLAYNMSFEKGVIERLASSFEPFRSHLLAINANMRDLMIPFKKRWYLTPAMKGSYSIKYVLPALVPELGKAYQELDGVQNGNQAMNAFATLGTLDEVEKQQVREALLAYCRLDTLAMVEILRVCRVRFLTHQ